MSDVRSNRRALGDNWPGLAEWFIGRRLGEIITLDRSELAGATPLLLTPLLKGLALPIDLNGIPVTPPWEKVWAEAILPNGDMRGWLVGRPLDRCSDNCDTWVIKTFKRTPTGRVACPPWCAVCLSKEGHLILDHGRFGYYYDGQASESESASEVRQRAFSNAGVVFYSFALLHCRNIGTEEREIGKPPRFLRKSRQQRAETSPWIRYKVLTIDPNHPIEREGPRHGTNLQALHLVRGHFARYTAERPLFGRHIGLFWRPQHLAGNPAIGAISKAYRLENGSPAAAQGG